MAKALRLGIMGTGYPCLRHGEAFQALPGVKLAAVADPDNARRRDYVKKFGAMEEYLDYRDMLEKAELDAVVVGLPTGMHAEACMRSFDAGLHVLCEKPPTTHAREMVEIGRRAARMGLTYMFSRQFRFSPGSLQARRLIAAGRVGKVYHAEAKWLRGRFIPTGPRSWFLNKERGGGVLLDLGIHAIDEAWFLMGCPAPVEVCAGMHCGFSHLAPKGMEYTAEDAAVGVVRFENGATLHMAVTFSLNWPGTVPSADGKPFNPQLRETSLYGTHGGVQVLNGREGREIIGARRGLRVRPLPPLRQRVREGVSGEFYRQAKDFVAAVRTGATPANSAEQAVMLMQMLDALRKSGDTGRAVRIQKVRMG